MTVREASSFSAAIQDLERRGIMPLRAPSLEPTRLALSRLPFQSPIDPRRVIIVAGTNGKGSTSKTLESLLVHAGRRVGLYTSPHLVSYRERIRVGGADISEEDFVQAWRTVAECTSDLFLSHFEMLTLMAVWVFFGRSPVDYAVFEVGLGGVWDATNAIPHDTAVICRLGLDHQELLGSTLPEIARNKFGIVTEGATVIHLPLDEDVLPVKKEVERATGSRWVSVGAPDWRVDTSQRIPRFFLESKWGAAEISLPGARGAENMNLALHVFAHLGESPAVHLDVLKTVAWPARMQRIEVPGISCPVFLSGDHNVQGVESLIELLRYYKYANLHLVIGIGAKKDMDPMLERLTSIPRSHYWLTRAQFQGRVFEQYGSWPDRAQGFFESPVEALRGVACRAEPEDLCLVTGSLYLAGDVLASLSAGDQVLDRESSGAAK